MIVVFKIIPLSFYIRIEKFKLNLRLKQLIIKLFLRIFKKEKKILFDNFKRV